MIVDRRNLTTDFMDCTDRESFRFAKASTTLGKNSKRFLLFLFV